MIEICHNSSAYGERVSVALCKVVGDAAGLAVEVGTPQLLGRHHLPCGRLNMYTVHTKKTGGMHTTDSK